MRLAKQTEVFEYIRKARRKLERHELDEALEDFGLYGDYRLCFSHYSVYKASNYVTLPYPGSLSEQPRWVIDNFTTFSLIEQWMEAFDDTPSAASSGDWTETDI